ncbi:MAG TPA: hypothetical protein VG735_11680 [Caulobacterales bacterium]|nr:hypothetical protein [Caulobacterales bacterium]
MKSLRKRVTFSLIMGAALGMAAAAHAKPVTVVTIDDKAVFPESITSTKAGDLIIGSTSKGAVYRAKAGSAKATLWLDPAKTGMRTVLGVFADDASNTLYVCSIAPPAAAGAARQLELAAVRTFDLKTGAAKGNYPMTDPSTAFCNDIAVGKDGAAYVSDTPNAQVLKLAKGASALTVWIKDERIASIDGLAVGDGALYVNAVRTNKLFSIAMNADGSAGAITELTPSLPLANPDGMRGLGGNKFLQAENSGTAGRITEVTVTGDKANIRVLKAAPGATAITKVGNVVWVNDAKFAYRPPNGPLKDQSPEPFVETAIPFK